MTDKHRIYSQRPWIFTHNGPQFTRRRHYGPRFDVLSLAVAVIWVGALLVALAVIVAAPW